MRIDLATPFADKDAAKALGARWDAARKTWYVTNVTDLTPFLRWIPKPAAAATGAAPDAAGPAASSLPISPTRTSGSAITGASNDARHCGCDVLPWDDCVHTANR